MMSMIFVYPLKLFYVLNSIHETESDSNEKRKNSINQNHIFIYQSYWNIQEK